MVVFRTFSEKRGVQYSVLTGAGTQPTKEMQLV